MKPTQYAKLAYETYCEETEWKSLVSGDDLPPWEDLPIKIQSAWVASAMAVKYQHKDNILAKIVKEGGM